MKNCYPAFPEIPYQKTSVSMGEVEAYAKKLIWLYDKEIVKTAYCMFRNESANGKNGVNNNYGGIQADNAVWRGLDSTNIIGTCIKKDNAGDVRRFICFNEKGFETCFEFMCFKVKERGLFVGSPGVKNSNDLAINYLQKWVGLTYQQALQKMPDINNFRSLYQSASKIIL